MCACKQACAVLHVLWCLVYIGAGTIQMVAGVFFLITLPIFRTGSNIWVGAWNILVGISCTIISCVGDLTPKKQETLLYGTFTILAINVVNLVLLEVGEWHFFMTDSIAIYIGDRSLKKLIYFAHMTTSISTAIAIVTAFIDSQLTFCSMQWKPKRKPIHEQVSDIEYIIPRNKSRSVAKQAHNIYNQYAQSWVFDAETPGSSKSDSPYLKLPPPTEYDVNTTVTLKTNSNIDLELDEAEPSPEICVKHLLVRPIVHVDPGSDESLGGRSLNYMKSFSRTASPVNNSDSSSQDSSCNPPIYECLERLTEPKIYRSRLNTAISLTAEDEVQHMSNSGGRQRLYSANVSPMHMEGPLIRPKSEIIGGNRLYMSECTNPTETVQYASLVAELQRSFKSNKDKYPQFSPENLSGSGKAYNGLDPQKTETKGSDTEFSKELEAALQLIQDLESPNTIETPSDQRCPPEDASEHRRIVSVKWRESDASDVSANTLASDVSAKTLSPTDFPDESAIILNNGKRMSLVTVRHSDSSQSSSGYSSPSAGTSKRPTPEHSKSPSVSSGTSSDTLIASSQMQITYAIHNRGNSAIISFFSPTDNNKMCLERRKSSTNQVFGTSERFTVEKHKNNKNAGNEVETAVNDISDIHSDKSKNLLNGPRMQGVVLEVLPSLQNPTRWSVMHRLTKKPIPPKLAPELEGAIYKPESLAFLTEVELIARLERSKSIHREIEQRVHHQQINGNPTSDSDC